MDRIAAFRDGSVHAWNRITRADELRVGFPANLAKSDAQELLDRDNLRRGWKVRVFTRHKGQFFSPRRLCIQSEWAPAEQGDCIGNLIVRTLMMKLLARRANGSLEGEACSM